MIALLRWLRRAGNLLAVVAVVLAVVLVAIYLWFPNLSQHKSTIEELISQEVHQPVQIERLETQWNGLRLSFVAQGVRIRGVNDTRSAVRLSELRMEVEPLPLLSGELRFRMLSLHGLTLEVIRAEDGRIKILDLATSGGDAGKGMAALAWWFQQERIQIKDSTLVWRDARDPNRMFQFHGLELTTKREDEQWTFSGSVHFPTLLGDHLVLSGKINGIPFDNDEWGGIVEFSFAGLNVAELPMALQELLPWKSQGRIKARLSASLVHGKPVGGIGELEVVDFEIPYHREQKPLSAERLQTSISWHQDDGNWRVLLLQPELKLDRVLRMDELEIERTGDTYTFSAQGVDLANTVAAVKALHIKLPWQYVLDRVQPAGVVHNAKVTIEGKLAKPDDWRFEGEFSGLGWAPYEHFPGLSGVSGILVLDPREGKLSVAESGVHLNFPQVLRDPIGFSRLTGVIDWSRTNTEWNVHVSQLELSNSDIDIRKADVVARLPVRAGPSPYLEARAQIDRLELPSIKRYLPAKIMKAKGVEWVDHAFAGGQATDGNFALRGTIKDFPFQDGRDGEFRLTGKVHDGVLVYDTDWPPVSEIEADVAFENQWLRVDGKRGKFMNSEVTWAKAVSDELFVKTTPKVLRVDGEARAKVNDVVQFLTQGPLIKEKDSMPDMSGSGEGLLSLKLDLPIGRLKESTQVAGIFQVQDGSLKFDSNGIGVTGLQGEISFTEQTVYGKALQARLFDGPVHFDVRSVRPQKPPHFAIDFQGSGNVKGLAPILSNSVVGFLEGDAVDWQGSLEVDRGHVELKVTTDGAGLTSTFPAPLAKSREERWPVSSRVVFEKGTRDIQFNIDDRLRGALSMRRHGSKTLLDRGQMLLHAGTPTLPTDPGLQVSVASSELDADQWLKAWRRGRDYAGNDKDKKDNDDSSLVDSLRLVRLHTQNLKFLGRELGSMKIRAHSSDSQDWVAQINGAAAVGAARAQFDRQGDKSHQFKLLLDRLYWPKGPDTPDNKEEEKTNEQPGDYPRLAIDADEFRYGDWRLGNMRFRARPHQEGWRIESFTADQDALHIKGKGLWHDRIPGQQTELQLEFVSPDSGAALMQLGYGNQVAGGKATMRANLSWPGGPGKFKLAIVDGDVELEAKKGRFLQVNPGGGRLMGLFNFDALARRLILDFSDVFSKGLAFDRVNAKGRIAQGDLFSDGIYIVGPAAMIEAQGRAGLAKEDYDMNLIIAPDFGGNLTLLSALANPAAGAVMFVVQRLFKKKLAKVVHYRYQVTGPWDNPNVVKLDRESIPAAGDEITTEPDQ